MNMEKPIENLLKELSIFYGDFFTGKRQFTYAYGSHITTPSNKNSDLDLVTICDSISMEDILNLKKHIINFHNTHNLEIDEEVPFEKKLICPYSLMDEAVLGKGFHYDSRGFPSVPLLDLSPEYLSSDELMRRILLNTITNKSFLLSGSQDDYEKYQDLGWRKIVEVIFKMNRNIPLEESSFLELMISNGERTGREYMGYMPEGAVREYLKGRISFYFEKFKKESLLLDLNDKVIYNE